MGKFSSLAPGQAGRYINGADKAMLAADPDADKADDRAADLPGPVALRIVDVTFQPRARFGPRWLVDVAALATGEVIAVDFAAAQKDGGEIVSRTMMFGGLKDALAAGETFDPVVLVRVAPDGGGNPFWTFEDATPEQIAANVAPVWLDDEDDAKAPAAEPPKVGRQRLAKAGAS